MTDKNIIHEIFPAEKRMARIDKLDIELETARKTKAISLTEYVRAKKALTLRRFKEFRRIEAANGWDKLEPVDSIKIDLTTHDPNDLDDENDENDDISSVTPRKRRYMHYAIFWVEVAALAWFICWLAPYLKKF